MQRFLFRFLRLYALTGLLALWLAPPAQAEGTRILVLGDSISAAYGMSLEQGWVALLARRVEQEQDGDYQVINASISGETTAGALRRLPALLAQYSPGLVIIELGGNDGLRGYPIGKFRANLENMVALSREAGARVILLPMEIPPNYGARYTSAFRDTYAALAARDDILLAPFILEGVATDPELMQPDGIHPTAEAQPLMLDNVLPTVLEALGQS